MIPFPPEPPDSPRPRYTACHHCTAKFFSRDSITHCPRCGGSLLRSATATPPWRNPIGGRATDGSVLEGGDRVNASGRHKARYDLRESVDALAHGKQAMQIETENVITLLARDCRVITVRQAASAFFSNRRDPLDCARRAARTLVRLGLATIRPGCMGRLHAKAPLLQFRPGDATPNFSALAWQNQKRWQAIKPRQGVCLVATEKARLALGGTTRPPRPRELEHDLLVTAVCLQLKNNDTATAWRHEDSFAAEDGERPDARYERDGTLVTVEVLGRGYTKQKMDRIWRAHSGGPLELW